ncbi:DUF1684 domain-containing protein [Flavobacterium sp.]|uniref:DUF1684 domain-containing protein n=1 Tax=Flavobacterium sp. TaxID=239 RepID=UPI0039E33F00
MKKILLGLLFCNSLLGFAQEKFDEVKVQVFQNELTTAFADSLKSPLTTEDRRNFHGLDFYTPDAKYFVNAKFKRIKDEKPFEMKTSTNRLPMYVKYGELTFTLEGKSCKLNVYQNVELVKKKEYVDYLFLPFSDLTSGNETYIGGRYIDLKIPKGDTMAIDFNQAYNPYCAYNHKYSCPIVPLENDLPVAIKAGVKKFHD